MSDMFRADLEWEETTARRVAVVRLAGSLSAGTIDEFQRVVDAAEAAGAQGFILDFERVDYVSSSGVRALLKLRSAAERDGSWVRLAAVRRAIREQVFDALGISRLFDLFVTVAEALAGSAPSGRAGAAGSEAEMLKKAPGSDKTVLVVDDDPSIRRVLERILTPAGYAVFTASNGDEGRSLAREKKPSIILMDINLPGLDGGEVAQQLADELRTADIPVIFISGLISGKDEADIGPAGYPMIGKPFDRAKLLNTVHRYIRAFDSPA
jgi:anti-anti-sigma factor